MASSFSSPSSTLADNYWKIYMDGGVIQLDNSLSKKERIYDSS